MYCLNQPLALLAQTTPAEPAETTTRLSRLEDISNNLNSGSLISSHWLIIAAGLVLLLLSMLSIMQWWQHRHEHSHPWLVYLSAARFAGLGLRHQWTLFWVARQQHLTSPLTLMLAPGTFDQHIKAYLESRASMRREGLRRRLQEVREIMYGDLVTASQVLEAGHAAV